MPDDSNNNEHNSTDRAQQYITAITPMIRELFRRSDAESVTARTYATPTVRFTTEELRKQIDRSIDEADVRIAALEARRRYLAFTREHLTPDSVFVMSASEAYGLLAAHQHTYPSTYPAYPAGLPL